MGPRAMRVKIGKIPFILINDAEKIYFVLGLKQK